MDIKLTAYIEGNVLPRYATTFDAAHGVDHVMGVIARSLSLARLVNVDERLAYVAAAYHDLGLVGGREKHHLLSGEMVMQDAFLASYFTSDELQLIKEAVEDHRASSSRSPRSIYGKIVAEADREIIPRIIVKRTILYGKSHEPFLDKEGQYERTRDHIVKKYGEGGYLKLWLPLKQNVEGLKTLRSYLKDETSFRHLFDEMWAEISNQE